MKAACPAVTRSLCVPRSAASLLQHRACGAHARLLPRTQRRRVQTPRAIHLLRNLMGSASRKPDADTRTDLPAPAPGVTASAPGLRLASFAGGCFWSVQLVYDREPGVTRTSVGYAQGSVPNPTYEVVCSGRSGVFVARPLGVLIVVVVVVC